MRVRLRKSLPIGTVWLDMEPARLSRKTAYNRGPARQFDPIAVRIEDHRNSRHVSKCYRRKALTHASVAQVIVHRINIRDLKGDVAPAARLTHGIDSSRAVFFQKNQAVSQAKGRTT